MSFTSSRPKMESWIEAVMILLPLILPSFGSEGNVLNQFWTLDYFPAISSKANHLYLINVKDILMVLLVVRTRLSAAQSDQNYLCLTIDVLDTFQRKVNWLILHFIRERPRINVSYMTSLCPDVDIDRKILRSGVCVDRKFSHPVRILCSDVKIDFTRSYSY